MGFRPLNRIVCPRGSEIDSTFYARSIGHSESKVWFAVLGRTAFWQIKEVLGHYYRRATEWSLPTIEAENRGGLEGSFSL